MFVIFAFNQYTCMRAISLTIYMTLSLSTIQFCMISMTAPTNSRRDFTFCIVIARTTTLLETFSAALTYRHSAYV